MLLDEEYLAYVSLRINYAEKKSWEEKKLKDYPFIGFGCQVTLHKKFSSRGIYFVKLQQYTDATNCSTGIYLKSDRRGCRNDICGTFLLNALLCTRNLIINY